MCLATCLELPSVRGSAVSVTNQEPSISVSSSCSTHQSTTVTQPSHPSGFIQSSQRPFNRLHPSGGVDYCQRPLKKPPLGNSLPSQDPISNKPSTSKTCTPAESSVKHTLDSAEENCTPKKFLWDQTFLESGNKEVEPNCKTQ